MDSQTTVQSRDRKQKVMRVHEASPRYLRHHFETVEQQREAVSFGMWLFLLTEIMFFGGLFAPISSTATGTIRRFVAGSQQLSIWLGA